MAAPGCPVPAISGLRRRWSFEFPRLSHPSAPPSSGFPVARTPRVQPCFLMSDRVSPARSSSDLPVMELRVASSLASFSAAFRETPGHPAFPLPAALADGVSGLPRILHLPAPPAMENRVASPLASFGVAGAQSSGYPDSRPSSPAFSMESSGRPERLP